MLVLFYTHLASEFPELLGDMQERYPNHELVAAQSRAEFEELLPRAEGIVTPPLSEENLRRAEQLQVHFIPYAGVNKVNRTEYGRRGIMLSSSHGNARSVAERAVALALSALGRIVEFHNDLATEGAWHRTGDPRKPFDYWSSLQGRVCGILGTGAIGTALARMLVGFECQIIGYNTRGRNPNPALFHATTTKLHDLLQTASVLFICLPLTHVTEGLIGTEELELFSGGALVDVSRGEIVQEQPLYEALRDRRLLCAGIDTWYRYPDPPDSACFPASLPFHELRNVVMSPHAGSHSEEGKRGQFREALENLRGFIESGTPGGLVAPEDAY
jgi:phosphoglycerate dehydrogenase-like enzyme